MFRYRLRTLLILMALGPPLIALALELAYAVRMFARDGGIPDRSAGFRTP
jgi:hypothetical protein